MEVKELIPLVPIEPKEKPIFPTYGLPDVIKQYSENLSDVYGIPVEMVAMPMFVACGSVLKKTIWLETGKYKNYPQFFVVLNAPSGVGKSEPLMKAFAPLQVIDRTNFERYVNEIKEWKQQCRINKRQKPPQDEPPKPTFQQLTLNDTTPEALTDALLNNGGSMTVFADELSGWFGNFGRYNKTSEASMYLSFFNNVDFVVNRKQDIIRIREPFVNVCGGIQPDVLSRTINSVGMQENGLASRFLFVNCTDVVRAYKSNTEVNGWFEIEYHNLIDHLAGLNQRFSLNLTPEAKGLFQDFGDYLTDLIRTSKNNFLNASLSKMEIHCLRLALVLQIIKLTEPNQIVKDIEPEIMQYAIDLCHYFIANIPVPTKTELAMAEGKSEKVLELLAKGMKQTEIAEKMNVSQQYISTIKKRYKIIN